MPRTLYACAALALTVAGLAVAGGPSTASVMAPAAGGPRMVPSHVSVEVSPNDSLKVEVGFRVTNQGNGSSVRASDRTVRVLLVGSSRQYQLGTLQLRPLGAGRSVDKTLKGRLPADVVAGSYRARVCVRSSGRDRCAQFRSAVTVDLPQLQLDHDSHDFGGVTLGSTSDTDLFTVTNTGDLPTDVMAASVAGDDADSYDLGDDTCTGSSLEAGDSCTLSVTFSPSSRGASSAKLVIAATPARSRGASGDEPSQLAQADLTGTGQADAALEISPTTADFDGVSVGSASMPQTFTVTNTGDVTTGVLTGGPTAGAYESYGDCFGTTLAAGASCIILVVFYPFSNGAADGSLSVSGEPGGEVSSMLEGNGIAPPTLGFDLSDFDFGNVAVGTDSAPKLFTLTNTGDEAANQLVFAISGAGSSSYTISDSTCGAILMPDAFCTVTVSFTPGSLATTSAQLLVAFEDGDALVDLTGAGVAPAGPGLGMSAER